MAYTPPAGNALNASWVGASAYTPPSGDAINAQFVEGVADVTLAPQILVGVNLSGEFQVGVAATILPVVGAAFQIDARVGVSARGAAEIAVTPSIVVEHVPAWMSNGFSAGEPFDRDSILKRLLSYLYASFDKNPVKILALRIGHPDGLKWQVFNRAIHLWAYSGSYIGTISLVGITMDGLAERLIVAGCTVSYQNPAVSGRDADALIDAQGYEWSSNGDHVYCYDSDLWALLDAFAIELERARDTVDAALLQAHLETSEGQWLDFWGGFFGIPRLVAEADRDYLIRMIVEVLRPRNNAMAIEQNVYLAEGVRVSLFEPWMRLFAWDVSEFDGDDHFQDGNFWTWTVFQPRIYDYVSLAKLARVTAIIERNRPAGVLPVRSFLQPGTWHVDMDRFRTVGGRVDVGVHSALSCVPGVLDDNLALSDGYEQVPVEFDIHYDGTRHVTAYADLGLWRGPYTWRGQWDGHAWGSRFTAMDVHIT